MPKSKSLQAQVLKLDKGLGEDIVSGALGQGWLAEASNCFYSKAGVLRLYRPELTQVGSLGTGSVIVARHFPELGKIALVRSTSVEVYSDSTYSLEASYTIASCSKANITQLGDKIIFACENNPLLAYGSYFEFCGSHFSVLDGKTAGVTITSNGDTQLGRIDFTGSAHKPIEFVRIFLARKLHTTGELKCKVVTDQGTYESVNSVYIGSLPYNDSTTKDFVAFDMEFDGADAITFCEVYLSISNLEHPDAPELYAANWDGGLMLPSYASLNTVNAAFQINGSRTVEGSYVATSGFDRLFVADLANNEILISGVNSTSNFDSDVGGKAGWFKVGFKPQVMLTWLNGLLISGHDKLETYAGNWPDDIKLITSYGNPVANPEAWFVSDARLYLLSKGRLIKASPLDKLGTFDFEEVYCPRSINSDDKLFYIPELGLLCIQQPNKTLVMQKATGQWTSWDLLNIAYWGDIIIDSSGNVSTYDNSPNRVFYETKITLPTIFLGYRIIPRGFLLSYGLPEGSAIELSKNPVAINYDSWNDVQNAPDVVAETTTYTYELTKAAAEASSLELEFRDQMDVGLSLDVSIIIPSGRTNAYKYSLNTLVLKYRVLDDAIPVGGYSATS